MNLISPETIQTMRRIGAEARKAQDANTARIVAACRSFTEAMRRRP